MTSILNTLAAILRIAYTRDLNQLELILLAALVPAAVWIARSHPHWMPPITWRPPTGMRAAVWIAVAAIAARVVLLALDPVPDPHVTDEYSFLLQADTFTHARLANPTPPLWEHFETIHEFFTPSYASMYFPAQGIILFLGRLLGSAWIGVLLSTGLMCGAIVWMLQGWLPPRWAFLGGAIAVVRFALFSYWINGYYGGAHAVIGGALVLGAWGRIARRGRRDAAIGITLGVGLAILAAGRPYEGVLLSLPVAVALLLKWRTRVMLAIALVLAIAACGLGYYCWRVTGSPWKAPYQVNQEQYGWPQTLLFTAARTPPAFRHAQMSQYFQWESSFHAQTSSDAVLFLFLLKNLTLWSFYVGPALSLALLALPRVLRDRRPRPLLFPAGVLLAGLAFSQTVVPHYAAPAAAAFIAILVQGLRHLRHSRYGMPLLAAIAVSMLLPLTLRTVVSGDNSSWCCRPPVPQPGRAALLRELLKTPGSHLVFVRYSPTHLVHDEWVYNEADIPASRVIWARVMSRDENSALVKYYNGRRLWIADPDARPPTIQELRP